MGYDRQRAPDQRQRLMLQLADIPIVNLLTPMTFRTVYKELYSDEVRRYR